MRRESNLAIWLVTIAAALAAPSTLAGQLPAPAIKNYSARWDQQQGAIVVTADVRNAPAEYRIIPATGHPGTGWVRVGPRCLPDVVCGPVTEKVARSIAYATLPPHVQAPACAAGTGGWVFTMHVRPVGGTTTWRIVNGRSQQVIVPSFPTDSASQAVCPLIILPPR